MEERIVSIGSERKDNKQNIDVLVATNAWLVLHKIGEKGKKS